MNHVPRTRLRVAFPAVLAAAAFALLAVGCGGSSESSTGVASLGTTTTSGTSEGETAPSSTDPQEVLLDYTECMREEGIDLPDPDFSGGGARVRAFGYADPDDPDFEAAQKKCGTILQAIQERFDPARREELQDAALEYAQCMRDNGIDMPDPDFSSPGGGPGQGGGIFGRLDRDDPEFQAAHEKCESAFAELGGRFRGGGEQ